MRIGFGYDVHRLVAGRKFILGGVEIPSEVGLLGHSDADVLCHAICDALLGSLALGDIGQHFPDSDERYAGISSLLLLKKVGELITQNEHRVCNLDATVVLEKPKLAPFAKTMCKNIAEALAIDSTQVSIKATTSEGMGFVGQREGVTAYAVVLVEKI